MEQEGVVFRPGVNVGVDVPVAALRRDFDAIVLVRRRRPRRATCPSRAASSAGIHFAMEYLTQQNRRCAGRRRPAGEIISAEGQARRDHRRRRHRRRLPRHRAPPGRARRSHQFELLPRPPDARAADNPWPQWPTIFRTSSAHEEGGERVYSVSTERFAGDADGRVRGAPRGRSRDASARTATAAVRAARPAREFELRGRSRAARDGLRRARAGRPGRRARRPADRARQRLARRRTG